MKSFKQTLPNTDISFNMVHIEEGIFSMESDKMSDSQPIHTVVLSEYWICDVPVTQALWAYIMQGTSVSTSSNFKNANRPVGKISLNDINKQFLPKLNAVTEKLRKEGTIYCLPTKNQWKYAANGGKYWKRYTFIYGGSDKLNEVGWYDVNSHKETKIVGLKTPNLLELYDMSGNVLEWCDDALIIVDSHNPMLALDRVEADFDHLLCGGSFLGFEESCTPSYARYRKPHSLNTTSGFRLALRFKGYFDQKPLY
jgi:formylglycine-generating enzyme required for sulfatase activity